DLLIATDPDADRLGIAVKVGEDYQLLTGNQTGAILIYYLLSEKKKLGLLPERGVVFNTVVTSDLGAKIARSYGFEVISTLTGFKFIGEQARFLEGTDKSFLFGYEESYGYVIKDEVRDKDSLQALLFAIEAANYYLVNENKSLVDKLYDIFDIYGNYVEDLVNIELFGIAGKKRIESIMSFFRNADISTVAKEEIIQKEDYELGLRVSGEVKSEITLPKSNVIKYFLKNGSWFVLRPSGTEPKLKVYIGGNGKSLEETKLFVALIKKEVLSLIDQIPEVK
ncbi:MAG: phospho-sugar mutase, partial [Candidatus Izemoplasmatales bacterium]